jgi:hypothetical protein
MIMGLKQETGILISRNLSFPHKSPGRSYSVTHYSTSPRHDFSIQILVNRYSSVVLCSVAKHGSE